MSDREFFRNVKFWETGARRRRGGGRTGREGLVRGRARRDDDEDREEEREERESPPHRSGLFSALSPPEGRPPNCERRRVGGQAGVPLAETGYRLYLLTGCGAVRRGLAVDRHTTRRAPQLRTHPHRARIDVGDLERVTNASTDGDRVADPAKANSPGVSQRGIKRRGRHRSGGGAPWGISRGSSASWARGRRRYEPARPCRAARRARETDVPARNRTDDPASPAARTPSPTRSSSAHRHSRVPRPSASPGEHPHRRSGQQR